MKAKVDSKEIEKSKKYVLGLTEKFLHEPLTEEDFIEHKAYRTRLVLADLVEREVITQNKATRLEKLIPNSTK